MRSTSTSSRRPESRQANGTLVAPCRKITMCRMMTGNEFGNGFDLFPSFHCIWYSSFVSFSFDVVPSLLFQVLGVVLWAEPTGLRSIEQKVSTLEMVLFAMCSP